MAQAASTGPLISLGGFAGAPNGGPPAEYSNEIGPSMFWQGSGLLSMAGSGSKDKKGAGGFPALFMSDSILALNQVIQPAGVALTTPGPAVSGVSLPLATAYAPGVAPGTPVPSGALGVGIETGFAQATVNINSPTVGIFANDKWRFSIGQFLSIAGAGVGGAMLFAQVTGIGAPGVNSITISPPAAASSATAQIGTYFGDPSSYAFRPSYSAWMNGGAGRFLMPDCGCARGVGVVSLAASPAGNVLIQGLDVYMRPQSEVIASLAGAGTAFGRKTYKVLLAATPQFTSALNYTVVTSDLIGLPLSVLPNQLPPSISMGGADYSANAVTQFADLTSPATTLTGDPRGAFQLSPAGPLAGGGTGPDGVGAFVIVMTLNPAQVLSASQFNPGTLFGVHPA
jgi:hypothetical protein